MAKLCYFLKMKATSVLFPAFFVLSFVKQMQTSNPALSATSLPKELDEASIFDDFPFEAPRLPCLPSSSGSLETAHNLYRDIKNTEELGESELDEVLLQTTSFLNRYRTAALVLHYLFRSNWNRVFLSRTLPTVLLYALFWSENFPLTSNTIMYTPPTHGAAFIPIFEPIGPMPSLLFLPVLVILSEVFAVARYCLFEFMASLFRFCPFMQYANGAVYADPTFFGIDMSNLLIVQ